MANQQGGREMAEAKMGGARFSKERYFWMVLSAALLTLIVVLFFQYVQCRDKLAESKREGEAFLAKLDAFQRGSLLTSWEIMQLKKQGLSNPEEDLASDLMRHRELIPYKGVMGGTMGFYSKNDIHVLTSRWAMAFFEDGHIGGHMLLEYDVSPGGEIQWKVISAYLD
jgi:hypothetical protein